MSFPVILNSSNYVSNNTYKVRLSTTIDLNNFECALGSLNIYYSWYNINSYPLNNNKFTLQVPTSSGTTTLNLTIPDGAYNITDLNNWLQYTLIQNNLYLVNSSNTNQYYATFQLSPTSYAVQLITYPVPSSLPASYTNPAGMTFPASPNQHYQFTILSSNTFKDIIGFTPGTYPPSATNSGTYTHNSDYTPNVNPISSVQMRVSCLFNPFSSNNQLLHVFTNKGASIGENIDASPNYESYVPCQGSTNEVTVSFFDQSGNVLNILDKNLTMKLVFRERK